MQSVISGFDVIAYVRRLKAAGVSQEQAEIQVEILSEIIEKNIATKQDLREQELRIIVKLGGFIFASTTIIISVLALLLKA